MLRYNTKFSQQTNKKKIDHLGEYVQNGEKGF